MQIKLIGLGYDLHGDAAAGLEIVQRWIDGSREYPGVEIDALLLDEPGVDMLAQITGLEAAILVDALRGGGPAGEVGKFSGETLEELIHSKNPPHGWAAAEPLSLGHKLVNKDLPKTLVLIGVVGANFTLGEELSPVVRSSIPEALEMIEGVISELITSQKKPSRFQRWIHKLREFWSST